MVMELFHQATVFTAYLVTDDAAFFVYRVTGNNLNGEPYYTMFTRYDSAVQRLLDDRALNYTNVKLTCEIVREK